LNSSYQHPKLESKEKININEQDLDKYITLREISGICNRWMYELKLILNRYLSYTNKTISEDKTLEYIKLIKGKYSQSTYRKHIYQIRKFLTHLKIEWANNIVPPPEPQYLPKRITKDEINNTLSYFRGNTFFKQIKAVILLGSTTGMRAEELYQLTPNDINLGNRIIHVNHNPTNGQSTKTGKNRISIFNDVAKDALQDYLSYFNSNTTLKCLFNKYHLERIFKDAPIKIKDLRKFFSQEWDRRGGPTSIKKILMGHSLRGDVDLMHYNCQSPEDLKKIYDKVMSKDNY
jgi:integrase/recombinase XerD